MKNNFSGKYLGAAHSKCNLERKTDKRLPIVFHNFKVSMKQYNQLLPLILLKLNFGLF